MAYVNYLSDEIGLIDHGSPPKAKRELEAFHKGWRVVGIPPGALERAREGNARVAAMVAAAGGAAIPAFDEAAWLMNAKRQPVRSNPYSIRQAADECAALATKAGWMRVEIEEIKRGEAPKQKPKNSRKTNHV